jgi:glycosyltransferase involved in cell wall biosynthesis
MGSELKPVRVLHLGSPNGLYGAERWILALVKHLDPAVVESHVGTICDEEGLDPPLLREAATLGAVTAAIEAHGRFNWSAVRQLRQYITAKGIEVLHTHFYKTDIIGLLAVRGTSCKLVTTPHGWSTQAGLALRIYETLDRLAFRYFDAVAPLSPELTRELERWAGPRLRYIQNGVDISEIDAVPEPARDAHAARGGEGFVVGYIGQLIPRKGITTLLQALAAHSLQDVRLVLVGEGPQRTELEALAKGLGISSRVEFMGYRKDRLALLKGFDAFVLPSLLEGIPRCLMESMAAGVPVIASDIPGCRDLVKPGVTGLLFNPHDVEELTRALNAIRDQSLRKNIATAARLEVEQNFSAAAMAATYQLLYRQLFQ